MARRRSRRSRSGPPVFKKRLARRIFALIVLVVSGIGGGVFLPGRVVSVADGDTITVLTHEGKFQRIRLYGVDSPESRQAGGSEATAHASGLALFREAQVQVIDTDRYGRSVALVTLPDGLNLNEEMVRSGHAWVYPQYCKLPQCVRWKVLEAQARHEKKGLWATKNPVQPWKWRAAGRAGAASKK